MDDLQHRPNHLPDHEPASVPGTSDTTKTGGLRVENYEASEDMANEVGIPESYMPYFDWDPTCPGSDRLEDVKKEWNLMIRLVERVWSQRDSASMREIAREWFATKSTAAMNVLGNILWLDFEHNVRRSFARVTVTNRDLRSKKKRERHRQEGRTLFLNTRLYYDRPEPSAEISLLEPAFNLSLLGDTDYRTMASKEESSELEHLAGALLHEVTYVSVSRSPPRNQLASDFLRL